MLSAQRFSVWTDSTNACALSSITRHFRHFFLPVQWYVLQIILRVQEVRFIQTDKGTVSTGSATAQRLRPVLLDEDKASSTSSDPRSTGTPAVSAAIRPSWIQARERLARSARRVVGRSLPLLTHIGVGAAGCSEHCHGELVSGRTKETLTRPANVYLRAS
jgi:hypothetical protein